MVCLGLEPGAAGWNPLSYGGTPKEMYPYLPIGNDITILWFWINQKSSFIYLRGVPKCELKLDYKCNFSMYLLSLIATQALIRIGDNVCPLKKLKKDESNRVKRMPKSHRRNDNKANKSIIQTSKS